MTIYYAHSCYKYGTRIEEFELGLIKKKFPNAAILNPSVDLAQGLPEPEIMKLCLDAIDNICDTVVFSTISGVVGAGVMTEVEHSLELGRDTYIIDGMNIIPVSNVVFAVLPEGMSNTRRIYAELVHWDRAIASY